LSIAVPYKQFQMHLDQVFCQERTHLWYLSETLLGVHSVKYSEESAGHLRWRPWPFLTVQVAAEDSFFKDNYYLYILPSSNKISSFLLVRSTHLEKKTERSKDKSCWWDCWSESDEAWAAALEDYIWVRQPDGIWIRTTTVDLTRAVSA
jgi:hypothetical protein